MTPLYDAQQPGPVVAVDGPAGSGKSSVSRAAALRLGFGFLDTGAFYRAVTWFLLERGVDLEDEAVVLAALSGFEYELSSFPADATTLRVGGVDVEPAIRTARVTASVSTIARIPAVRERLNHFFRWTLEHRSGLGVVVEGRDITTVVAPDAGVRVLLTADPAVRAARRAKESGADTASTASAIAARDAKDSKVVDFLSAAPGVTTIDSTDLDFDATVEALVRLVEAAA